MKPRILVNDTECTGLVKPAAPASGVVQVAYVELDENLNYVGEFEAIVDPGCPIEPKAMEIHGITEEMVKGKPPLADVYGFSDPVIFIAHNKRFDYPRLSPYLENCVDSLCTLEAAKRFLKGQPNNKLVTLVEHFGLEKFDAHDALGDVKMTVGLLRLICQTAGLNLMELIARMNSAKLPTEMPFGKHRGQPLGSLSSDYILWLLKLDDLNDGLRRALEMQRKIRGNT